MKARDIAKYILATMPLDHLKLQKILFYCQAVHLVLNNGQELFNDKIEAWAYGPVIPEIYHQYKIYGFDTLDPVELDEIPTLTNEQRRAIDLTLEYYGAMTGIQLMAHTHDESPWKDAYNEKPNTVIEITSIYKYYKNTLIVD
jgi:uncharacterized phage-associated protein